MKKVFFTVVLFLFTMGLYAVDTILLEKSTNPSSTNPNETLTQILKYTVVGSAYDNTIWDTMPTEYTIISFSETPVVTGGVSSWFYIGLTDTVQSITWLYKITYCANCSDGGCANITNTAHARASNIILDSDAIATPLEINTCTAIPTITIQKFSTPGTGSGVTQGQTVTFYIDPQVKSAALQVLVWDTLSTRLTYVSASPAPSSIVGNVYYWGIGDVVTSYAGNITITATVNSWNGLIYNYGNIQATDVSTIRSLADILPIYSETVTQTITETVTPTITKTVTQTITPTVTQTITETVTETVTPTITQTVTETVTPSITKTITQTVTETVTQTITKTITETTTPSVTPTITETVTQTVTKTVTKTVTPTFTGTPTRTMTVVPFANTYAEPPIGTNITGRSIAVSSLTITAKGSVGTVINPLHILTGASEYVTALDFGAAMSVTLKPKSGNKIFLEGLVIGEPYLDRWYFSMTQTPSTKYYIDPNAIGTLYFKIMFPADAWVVFYAESVSRTSGSAIGAVMWDQVAP